MKTRVSQQKKKQASVRIQDFLGFKRWGIAETPPDKQQANTRGIQDREFLVRKYRAKFPYAKRPFSEQEDIIRL